MSFYKEKKIAGFFIFINLFYLTNGLIPALGLVYVMMLFLILAISFFYFYKVNLFFSNSGFVKALDAFVLLISIYGILHILLPVDSQLKTMLGEYNPHTYLTNAYRPLLQVFPLYYFSRKGYIDTQVIKNWIIPSIIMVMLAYYTSQIELLSKFDAGTVERTNNVGYLAVSIIPILYFYNNHIVRYILLTFVIILVFLCAKRGAIIIAGVSVLWFIYNDLQTTSKGGKFLVMILVAFASVLVYNYILKLFEESYYMSYLLDKTMEGNSSGRDILYSKAWNSFINADLITILFGNGADSSYIILGNRAHNDWFELLTNQGVVGIVTYAILWIEIFKYWRKVKNNKFIFVIYGLVLTLFFMKTLFSMWYNSISPVACLPFAWCIAVIDSKQSNLRTIQK